MESAGLYAVDKFSIAQPNRPKVADALSGGMVEQDGVFDFWRHPHPATRTVLLKVDVIQCPEVYRLISH